MEFLINMKEIPEKGSSQYDSFFKRELEKIKYGVTIDGIHFHGWLYWHLNHWNITMDVVDPVNGEVVRKFKHPDLRDNEWIINDNLIKAEEEKKGLCIIGCRRFGKSVSESSYLGRSATIYEGSESVIVGNNKDDLGVITSLCDKGLNSLHEYFKFGRIADDWKKEVSLGFKDKSGTRHEWSKIFIRNTDGGQITEVVAGTTPKALIYDEIGKAKYLEVHEAAKSAYESPYGWRLVPWYVGTGGDFENGQDAQTMFLDPDLYNMVAQVNEDGSKTCVFVSGTYHLEFPKKKTTLGDYYNIENKDSELYLIDFYYSDHEENRKKILAERERLAKAKDGKALLKYKMYYPLCPEDCFLTETGNDFPIEAAQQHLDFLLKSPDLHGTPTVLFKGVSGKIEATLDEKRQMLWTFPHNKTDNTDCPIIIYEPPISDPPNFLYIAGGDPYNVDQSVNSNSLGALYIYKRMYDPIGGTFQQRIVASYVARPETMKEWHEKAEMLLEYYNATIMIENVGTNFIQYLDTKNKGHLLADGYSLLKEINYKTSIQSGRSKGLPPTPSIIKHCMNLFIEYCMEEIVIGSNPDGTNITALGVVRITDPMLLKEIIAYKKGLNVDRIVAFRHIMAYDKHLEKLYSIIDIPKIQEKKEPIKMVSSPFILLDTTFKPFSNPF